MVTLRPESLQFQSVSPVMSDSLSLGVFAPLDTIPGAFRISCGKYYPLVTIYLLTALVNNSNNNNQKFIFYQLDNNYFAIVDREYGNAMSYYVGGGKSPIWTQNSVWGGSDSQQWTIRQPSSGQYKFINKENIKVLDVCDASYVPSKAIILYEDNNGANQLFKKSGAPIPVQPFIVNIEPVPDVPDYDPVDGLFPLFSEKAVTGSSLIPCIMIQDTLSSSQKIQQSPYYTLVKTQFWTKKHEIQLPAGASQKLTTTFGMSTTTVESMTRTTGMEMKIDFGFAFKAITAALSGGISSSLQVTQSTSETNMSEFKEESSFNNTTGVPQTFAYYVLTTEYTLYRMNGQAISTSWIASDNVGAKIVSYPDPTGVKITSNVVTQGEAFNPGYQGVQPFGNVTDSVGNILSDLANSEQ